MIVFYYKLYLLAHNYKRKEKICTMSLQHNKSCSNNYYNSEDQPRRWGVTRNTNLWHQEDFPNRKSSSWLTLNDRNAQTDMYS